MNAPWTEDKATYDAQCFNGDDSDRRRCRHMHTSSQLVAHPQTEAVGMAVLVHVPCSPRRAHGRPERHVDLLQVNPRTGMCGIHGGFAAESRLPLFVANQVPLHLPTRPLARKS